MWPRFNGRELSALLRRELRSALINRYFQAFFALAVFGGIAAVVFGEDANASGRFLFQIGLYFVSLFSVLVGVSSAQAEREEWPLLLSQPMARGIFIIGKFCALLILIGFTLFLLFLPALFGGSQFIALLDFFALTLLLAAAFLAVGLWCGFLAHDRAQGLMLSAGVWLLLLVGVDLIALFAARWPLVQRVPDLWAATLMLNPIDAFRIEALFSMQQVPAEAANTTPLAAWWTSHTAVWFVLIASAWMLGAITLANARLNRWES